MRRRSLLGRVAAGTIIGLAGCPGRDPPVVGASDRAAGTDGSPTTAGVSAGPDLPVPASALTRSVPRDDIPAITDPAFGDDWAGIELDVVNRQGDAYTTRPRLRPESRVIGVHRDGRARAYPLKVLVWHEVVNDRMGGPLLVTYCPLCRSGVTAIRRVRGGETVFGVDGRLWRSNLVSYDRRTDSLWSQIEATAIRGPMTGEDLDLVPSSLTTWGAWRGDHPETRVLLPPPHSTTVAGEELVVRDYASRPYARYDDSERVPGSTFDDDRLHPKTLVVGVAGGGETKAYALSVLTEEGVVNDAVGGRPVVVAVAPGRRLVAYDRRVEGTTLRFGPAGDRFLRAGGSRWDRTTGRAVAGPHRGRRLDRANDVPPLFWFSWLAFHPETTLFAADG